MKEKQYRGHSLPKRADYRRSGIEDVASRHGVTKFIIRRELKSGRLKGLRVGGRVLITAEAEQAWLDSLPDYNDAITAVQS